MFTTARILHTTTVVEKDKLPAIVSRLHELGVCEIKQSEAGLEETPYSYDTVKDLEEAYGQVTGLHHNLEKYIRVELPKKLLKDFFFPPERKLTKAELVPPQTVVEEAAAYLEGIEQKVTTKLGKLEKLNTQVTESRYWIKNLGHLPEIELKYLKNSDNISVAVGLMLTVNALELKNVFKEEVTATQPIDEKRSLVIVFYKPGNAFAEQKLHELGVETLELPEGYTQTPAAVKRRLKTKLEQLSKRRLKLEKELEKIYESEKDNLVALIEELEIARERATVLQKIKASSKFVVLEAWVLGESLESYKKLMKKSSNVYMEIDERSDAPTKLDNPDVIKPFESLTKLYSLPKYGRLDPTPILALTFTFFFGFMLTDFAYGLILLGIAFLFLKARNKDLKPTGLILAYFGFSSMTLGILFGSYFGDIFQRIGVPLPVPIDPMRQVMVALTIALAIGAVHLTIGLLFGFIENLRRGLINDALAKQGVWLFFLGGLVMFATGMQVPALIAFTLSVSMHILYSFEREGPIFAVLSTFDFSSFIGDLFSYARLMALAVGTAGIALAVNFMTLLSMEMIPYIGVPLGIVIFVLGHLFNIAMNGLGSFIHTTRLHFLEFFTKFYEGGGKAYTPFQSIRKTTYVR